jgi:hypothetical protein
MMKAYFVVTLALVAIAVSAYSASGQSQEAAVSKSAKPKTQLVAPKQGSDAKPTLTGSYIGRQVRRSGTITDGPFNVSVIDSDMIRRSGATDLRQVLVRTGFGR